MAQLPIVIVGAGAIGMRHVAVATSCPETTVAAVVEPDAARRNRLQTMGLKAVAAIDDVPDTARAAVIATPTGDHHGSALACLEKGWPVLVEKPVAGTLDQANELCAVAATKSLPLFTGHHRRCHPFSQAARDMTAALGDLVGVQGLWSLRKPDEYFDVAWRRAPGAGPLMTNLSHEVDLLQFLLGDIVEVTALSSHARRGLAVEDTAALAFRFLNGAMGSFLISDAGASPWSFESATGENPVIAASHCDYIRMIGTEGALAFPSLTVWGCSDEGEVEWSRPLQRTAGNTYPQIDPLLTQMSRFAAVVMGGEDDVLCTGKEGTRALEITLACGLSAVSRQPVKAGGVPGDFDGAPSVSHGRGSA